MSTKIYQRSAALGLAFVLTLAMLGGIDTLAQGDAAPVQWAQQASAPSA